ncbi:TPA: major capsid protein [Acinetobacter baumannii]|uniref:major capsid protein n=1 Tax=Acinetobacter baumannii TaxID=470 RepID=UPI00338F377F
MENQKRGVLTLTNVQRFGVGAAVGAALITNANAAVDVTAPVATLTTDGTAAITAVGAALLGLAGVAVVFKWVKAAFFS